MGPTAGSAHALRNEINVTPLVDVCLVLLIIFMVVMPLLNEEVPVRLPYGANPDPKPQGEGQLRLSLAWGSPRVVFVGGDPAPIPLAALPERLEELRERKPWSEVVVRADRRLTYGEVRKVLRTLNEAGIRELSLAVDPVSPSARE
jgi:biopolymer transport protein ExbD